MSEFVPNKLDLNSVNNGSKFADNRDTVSADDFNKIIEGVAYADENADAAAETSKKAKKVAEDAVKSMETSKSLILEEINSAKEETKDYFDAVLDGVGVKETPAKAKIYGVRVPNSKTQHIQSPVRDGKCVRTRDAIGLGYSFERDNSGYHYIKSDFDNCYPWSDIIPVEKDAHFHNPYLGEHTNAFVKIPKFYTRIKHHFIEGKEYYYDIEISGTKYDGFSTLFVDGYGNEIDYILVGRYESSLLTEQDPEGGSSETVIQSAKGYNVLTQRSMNDVRQMVENINSIQMSWGEKENAHYQMYDIWTHEIIKQLFLVEFAEKDSQAIAKGYTDPSNVSAIWAGNTRDDVKTGSAQPLDSGLNSFTYRYMENLWGNTWTYVDGIWFVGNATYVCRNPKMYDMPTSELPKGYYLIGKSFENFPTDKTYHGWVDSVGFSEVEPLISMVKTAVFGSKSTIGSSDEPPTGTYCDAVRVKPTANIFVASQTWKSGAQCGLFSGSRCDTQFDTFGTFGSRICFKPIKG